MLWQIIRAAVADVRHDWILFSCVVCAIGAVFSPLLILYGLKRGYIDAMRHQLLHDPRNREIRPRELPKALQEEWFTRMRNVGDVEFVIPSTATAETVALRTVGAGNSSPVVAADMIPSGPGDPLLAHHSLLPPSDTECILTEKAALNLNVSEGAKIVVSVQRTAEQAERAFVVRGIIPGRSVAKNAIFIAQPVLDRISRFKWGLAVPEYGWPGGAIEVAPSYSHVLIIASEKLNQDTALKLRTKTGFSQRTALTRAEVFEEYVLPIDDDPEMFRIEAAGRPGGEENIAKVMLELGGSEAVVMRTNPRMPASLTGMRGQAQVELISISLDGITKGVVQTEALPEWATVSPTSDALVNYSWRRIAVSLSVFERVGGGPWQATVETPEGSLSFPVVIEESKALSSALAWIPSVLGGILHSGQKSAGIAFDPMQNKFVNERSGHRGFRLFARDLEGVERLTTLLSAQSMKVDSALDQIAGIREFDNNMTSLIKLVGVVTGAGAIGALLTSLLASIERKKRDFGILRLMGTARIHVVLIPLVQAQLIVGFAFGLAVLIFRIFASAADQLFIGKLAPGQTYVSIQNAELASALGGVSIVAMVVALLASARLFSIEPADAVRWE
jgi:putative ABC transport system permease protein